MDAEVWKEFPLELHQHILQYCSVPELCRLRIVCRAWNDLIHHTHFASRAQLQNRFICISAGDGDIGYDRDAVNANLRNSQRWELIDVSARKFYWINKEFLYDFWSSQKTFVERHRTLAADKGLLCVLWSTLGCEVMQIVNPVTRSVIEVPLFQRVYMGAMAAMTVAEDYSSFTLYLIFRPAYGMLSLARFDSQEGKWRVLSSQPETNTPMHLLKLNESLYMLLWNIDSLTQLFAFDTVSETWTDTRMELPTNWPVAPRLVTALGRLFVVMLNERRGTFISVQILEIDVFSNTYSILTTMDENYPEGEIIPNKKFRGDTTAVVGCGNLIVLASGTGRSFAYDMLNNVWSEWMSEQEFGIKSGYAYGLSGMAMILTLNPVPVPGQQHHH